MTFMAPLLTGAGAAGAAGGIGIGTIIEGVAALGSLLGAFKSNTPSVPEYKDVAIPTAAELGTTLTQEQAFAQQEAEQQKNKRRLIAADLDNRIAVSTSNTRYADALAAPASTTKATLLGG